MLVSRCFCVSLRFLLSYVISFKIAHKILPIHDVVVSRDHRPIDGSEMATPGAERSEPGDPNLEQQGGAHAGVVQFWDETGVVATGGKSL